MIKIQILLLCVVVVLTSAVGANSANCTAASKHSCLPQCQIPFRSPQARSICMQAVVRSLFNASLTPASGPNVTIFLQRVANLGLLFEPNAVLSISPLGIFRGVSVIADYIATFVHPIGLGSVQNLVGYDIHSFVASGYVVAASIVFHFRNVYTGNRVDLTINNFIKFTRNMKIMYGENTFVRIPEFQLTSEGHSLDYTVPGFDPLTFRVNNQSLALMVNTITQINEGYCVPRNLSGYKGATPAERAADARYYLNAIPRTDYFGIVGNNTFCRFLHCAYATVDPTVHCAHIGRSGGTFCTVQNYTELYNLFPPGVFLAGLY